MNTFNTARTEKTTNVWLTPRYVLDLLGQFDTDPCAATVRPWDCARINYTVEDNGLLLPWEGRVWLNPPYGNEAEAFMERMSMHQSGGLALIFMRSDTRWFQRCVLSRARYLFLGGAASAFAAQTEKLMATSPTRRVALWRGIMQKLLCYILFKIVVMEKLLYSN